MTPVNFHNESDAYYATGPILIKRERMDWAMAPDGGSKVVFTRNGAERRKTKRKNPTGRIGIESIFCGSHPPFPF